MASRSLVALVAGGAAVAASILTPLESTFAEVRILIVTFGWTKAFSHLFFEGKSGAFNSTQTWDSDWYSCQLVMLAVLV